MADRKGSYVEPTLSAVLRNGSEILVGDRWRSRFALQPVIDDVPADDAASLEGKENTRPPSFRAVVARWTLAGVLSRGERHCAV